MSGDVTLVEQEIRSTPEILRRTLERLESRGAAFAAELRGPAVFLGCGSSSCIGMAAASLYEAARGEPAQGTIASEYRARAGWTHVAISRTGQTTELIEAMRRARAAGARVALICGGEDAPAAAQADLVLPLEFAAERSVIQTRFIAAATFALRSTIDPDLAPGLATLPERMEAALAEFDPEELAHFTQIVFLGRGWRHGIAMLAALNLQETALMAPNGYQTLEYRHGPLAAADEATLVWCLDPQDDPLSAAVLRDVGISGATVRCTGDDPLIAAAQAQLLALRLAALRGIDPDAPRNLVRAIVLSDDTQLSGEPR